MEGHLSKLRINAFSDILFSSPLAIGFEAYFNPASYSVNYKVAHCGAGAIGSGEDDKRFIRLPSRTYTFTLEIDGTGASGPKVFVPAEVTKFMAATYQYQNKSRRPPFLILSWGTMLVKCVLNSVSVEYTLFSPNGIPLRARLQTSFDSVNAPSIIKAIAGKDSKLNSFFEQTLDGDTPWGKVQKVYGTTAPLLGVAAANGLSNIKKLPPGLQMIFPPKSKDK